jgi:hypothetical protein
LALFAFPVFVGVLGLLKVSAMAVFLGAVTLVYLTTGPLRRNRNVILGLSLAFVAFFLVRYTVGTPGAETASVLPLAYLRRRVATDWRGYYPLVELQILLPAVAMRLWQEKCGNLGDFARGWRSGALLDVGFVVIAAAVGFVPGLILDIGGGSASGFTAVQHWIALAIILGVLLSAAQQPSASLPWSARACQLPLWRVGAWFLVLSVGVTLLLNTLSCARTFVQTNLADRGIPPSSSVGARQRWSIKTALRHGDFRRAARLIREQTAKQQARTDAKAQTIDRLAGLYQLPIEEKRITLVYIPRTNRAFWDLLGPPDGLWLTPFVAPALSGLALIDGLPDAADLPEDAGYGYLSYNWRNNDGRPLDRSRGALIRHAEGMGFKRILVLDKDSRGAPLLSEWCLGGAQPLLD